MHLPLPVFALPTQQWFHLARLDHLSRHVETPRSKSMESILESIRVKCMLRKIQRKFGETYQLKGRHGAVSNVQTQMAE